MDLKESIVVCTWLAWLTYDTQCAPSYILIDICFHAWCMCFSYELNSFSSSSCANLSQLVKKRILDIKI